ncbi:hypothetical protein BJP36_37320 [Moorena producens JHB]|uniref:Uncharacterized protein n=1 Tax=Moorena producens (strain JHB) TaxID=1454205 RepID=A0A9Q9SU79_MOOP1|nr:hypothetical protein [Moorena producens]WAN69757.1 hypothetical protein BJP36_37320 [Moorena producens JHB]
MLVAGCWLSVTGCWLLVAGCRLQVAGCWLLVVGCRLQDIGYITKRRCQKPLCVHNLPPFDLSTWNRTTFPP